MSKKTKTKSSLSKDAPKKTKTKKNNSSTDKASKALNFLSLYPESNPENLKYFELFRNMNSWTEDTSEDFINKFCVDLLAWAHQGDSYRMNDILDMFGISEELCWHWRKRFPQLKRAYRLAMNRLASRREMQAATGKLNPQVIMPTMSMYCPTHAAALKYKAMLNQDPKNTDPVDLSLLIQDLITQEWNDEHNNRTQTETTEIQAKAIPSTDNPENRE